MVCSVASYAYEIHAQPYGQQKKTVQATWNDDDLKSAIGIYSTKKLNDPLCYTTEDCQVVANHEGEIVQLQRSRCKFKKIMHLQDEEGDVIQILHPYSQNQMKILITDLVRKIKIPVAPNTDGYMIDEIEGCKI
jgi:hypothetical protein